MTPRGGRRIFFLMGGGQPASKSTTHTRKTQGTRTSCCVVIKGWSRLSSWHRNWPLTGVLVAAWRKRWLQHGACAQNIAPELRFGLQIGTRITFRHPDMFRNCVLTPKHSMGRTRGTVKRGTVISRNYSFPWFFLICEGFPVFFRPPSRPPFFPGLGGVFHRV